jgi:hypothetical protein
MLLGCVALWVISVPSGAADPKDKKAALNDADVSSTIAFNQKTLQDALGASGKVEKPAALKAQTAAWMIAAAAQTGGAARNAKLATLRDAAIKLAGTIKAEKFDDARAEAKALSSLKPDDKAKLEAVEIVDPKKLELEDIMNQFAGVRGGGLDIEEKLEDWETKPLPKGTELLDTANQISVIFDAIHSHKVDKAAEQPRFIKFADAAYLRSRELAEAARKGDEPATRKAIKSLNQACADCHKDFKPK